MIPFKNTIMKITGYYYLSKFFGQLSDGKHAGASEMFWQAVFHDVKYLGLMWILGISVIGLPV